MYDEHDYIQYDYDTFDLNDGENNNLFNCNEKLKDVVAEPEANKDIKQATVNINIQTNSININSDIFDMNDFNDFSILNELNIEGFDGSLNFDEDIKSFSEKYDIPKFVKDNVK